MRPQYTATIPSVKTLRGPWTVSGGASHTALGSFDQTDQKQQDNCADG